MSGIAIFVPNEELYTQAENILREKKHHVIILKRIKTEEAVAETQNAISQGVNIVVARGRQAMEIKRNTNVAVVDITITAQELGLAVMRAKEIVGKECPRIAVVGWPGMLCDTTYFDQLYHVDLKRYILKEVDDWRNTLGRMGKEDLDIVIGGDAALEGAYQIGVPGIHHFFTGESIRVALKNAESLYRMSELEQHNYAQFSTILDSVFTGIMKVSTKGKILMMNHAMEHILGCSSDAAVGQPVEKLLRHFEEREMFRVLSGELENYSTFLTIKDVSVVVSVEPIIVGEWIDGALISCNRMRRLDINDKNVAKEQYLRGYVAHGTFDDISKKMKGMRKIVEKAKLYAQSSSPMLIEGISGPELDAIVQGIHNYSMKKNGPFIMINMAGLNEDQQMKTLFGGKGERGEEEAGMIQEANHGTLVIQSIDKLTLPTQYCLIRTIRAKRLMGRKLEETQRLDIRIIACTAKNLTELRSKYQFRSDLYFTLKPLRLRIPNLADRKEDVEYLLDSFTRKYMEYYSRYHVMTAGARRVLLEYPWEGNSIQLEAFCERMVLTVGKRSITEGYVRELLDELYHQDSGLYDREEEAELEDDSDDSGEDEEFVRLRETLKMYNGNRALTARELNISTTTLWRRMKKFGLDEK